MAEVFDLMLMKVMRVVDHTQHQHDSVTYALTSFQKQDRENRLTRPCKRVPYS